MNKALNLRKTAKAAACIFAVVMLVFISAGTAFASRKENRWFEMNEEAGHAAVIIDQAELLTPEEEDNVMEEMRKILPYANAIFVGIDVSHTGNIVDYAKASLEQVCATGGLDGYNSVIFMIDMYYRELAVYVGETTGKVITKGLTETISDNIYKYASKGQYDKCALNAFEQIFRVLDGQAIAQPMRFITAGLLAIFAGLIIAFLLVRSKTKRKEAAQGDLMSALLVREIRPKVSKVLKSSRKVPHVQVSASSGGGGFHSSGGGGFHSSGGGGFHSSGGGGFHSSGGGVFHSSGGSHHSGSSGHGHGGSHRF